MSDVLTPSQRQRCMSHIRNKATKPEKAGGNGCEHMDTDTG